ncbi:protein PHLOEM PROTEIN 2-LIKE A10 [Iris pallida]|uniref:Protein PHLOEM PROTEIN 2-LIKE A10 n=1 Tax=Iris pallida TaxID=29817 RepID=A0AAX6GR87_IRIPA|nr:protein PHLOEM PROTEIN 2-LIKE A10 [Iris pallida]KAJ6831256.1 protein PHLOEM PROTEIN 2-LIKE A10 [Iris pallida]
MSLDLLRRRRKWLFLFATAGVSGYAAYRIHRSPPVTEARKKLSSILKTLTLVSDAASSSAEAVSLLSSDLNRFLRSDSDEVPNSLKQLSKLARSDEMSASVSRVSETLAAGVSRGIASGSGTGSGFSDKLLDKLLSPSGSGFVSAVVGSFARNLVVAFYSTDSDEESSPPWWIRLVSDDRTRDFADDCIRSFVSTAVAVYLDKTMEVNTYDEFFTGLTNPRHESRVKDFMVSVCNGAVETLVRTSHQVLTAPDQEDKTRMDSSSSDERIKEIGRWVNQVSSTLAVPSNRRLVLDVTGRVTFETVKSFLEFVMRKSHDGVVRGAGVAREEVVGRGLEVVRYVSARSMLIATICFALCMHVMSRMRVLIPA